MTIDNPSANQIPGLRQLWQQAFGDTKVFLDGFFATGFSPHRCRCITENGQIVAALYWFDCEFHEKPVAYLYAVATAESFRGKGFCRRLMEETHAHLAFLGYTGAILVPASKALFNFYARIGYALFSTLREFSCFPGEQVEMLRQISPEEYARLRRNMLPENGVIQDGATLAFLGTYASFYTGDGLLLAAVSDEDTVFVPELLGDPGRAPGIVTALGGKAGIFRTPGEGQPFSMYRSFTDEQAQTGYFALALD